MKCPQCLHSQKFKDGMTCGNCGRQFALNPKIRQFSDMAVHKAIEQVSESGHYYFTYNQLFAQIFRIARKKGRIKGILSIVALFFTGIGVLFFLFGDRDWFWYFVMIGLFVYIYSQKLPKTLEKSQIREIIDTYHKVHPIEKMVDGKRFADAKLPINDDETQKYAPERILIVEHNDMADMLIMNRFHLENKTLVVSAEKYPRDIFDACQDFLRNHPDLPLYLIHDASMGGSQMREKLLADPSWSLNAANVKDIGLFPQDTDHLKTPIWLPPASKDDKILMTPKSNENIRNGYKMPVDVAPPRSLMVAAGLAAVSGAALLSEELLAEMQQDAAGSGVMGILGGGFG